MSHRSSGGYSQGMGQDDDEDHIAPPVMGNWGDTDEDVDEEMVDEGRDNMASDDWITPQVNGDYDMASRNDSVDSRHSPSPSTSQVQPRRQQIDSDEVRRRLHREQEIASHAQAPFQEQHRSLQLYQPTAALPYHNHWPSSSTSGQGSNSPSLSVAMSSTSAFRSSGRGSRGRGSSRRSRGRGSRGRSRGGSRGSHGVSRAPISTLPPPLFPTDSQLMRPPPSRESAAASRSRMDGNCVRLEHRVNSMESNFRSELAAELHSLRQGLAADVRDHIDSLAQLGNRPLASEPSPAEHGQRSPDPLPQRSLPHEQGLPTRPAPTYIPQHASPERSPIATSSRVQLEDLPSREVSRQNPSPDYIPMANSSRVLPHEAYSTDQIGRMVTDALLRAVVNLSSTTSVAFDSTPPAPHPPSDLSVSSPTSVASDPPSHQPEEDVSADRASTSVASQEAGQHVNDRDATQEHPPLIDRIGPAPSEESNGSPVVWLGPYDDLFPSDYVAARALLAEWSGEIILESQMAVPIPRFIYVKDGGRYLRLVFCTAAHTADPTNAAWFVEMWNTWAPVCLPHLPHVLAAQGSPSAGSVQINHVPTTSSNNTDDSCAPYSIVSWNIAGNYDWGMLHEDFRQLLLSADVILLQETHHYEYEEAIPPEGFLAFSCPRSSTDFAPAWGGVATFVRPDLKPIYREEFSGPDFIAVEIGGTIIFNVYILPHTTMADWSSWTDVHPFTALEQAIALATELGLSYIICGDINARTGSRYPTEIGHPRRSSVDWITDTRGRSLLEMAQAYNLTILNGSDGIPGRHSSWTYCQAKTDRRTGEPYEVRSVIDYVLSSSLCLPFIQSLTVSDETAWSDHNFLRLEIIFPGLDGPSARDSHRRKRVKVEFPLVTRLDHMLNALIHSEQLPLSEELDRLYGRAVKSRSFPIKVYSDGSCITVGGTRCAGAGVYFGPGNSDNLALRATGQQTNNCGELYAVLAVLHIVPPSRALELYTDSHYVIRSLVEFAPMHAKCGWAVPNGQLLRQIASGIEARSCPISFHWVRGHSGNVHNENADALASQGAGKPLPLPNSDLDFESKGFPPRFVAAVGALTVQKVSTDLPPLDSDISGDAMVSRNLCRRISFAHGSSHRGRSFKRMTQIKIQERLLEASSKSQTFWRVYKSLRYPHPLPSQVSVQQLYEVFVPRMNPPDPKKCIFDTDRLHREDVRDAKRDRHSPLSRFQVLNEPVTIEDVASVKAYLKERKHSNATGTDDVMYTDILTWDNALICDLLNECFKSCDSPGAWMSTLIAAIPKVGKDASLPANYRTIALESCFLKFATLLVAQKFTSAAEAANILPRSQNGFRAGYRTNNNAFVLRALIDKVRASGQSLYVAFVDISNAFPSTNQSALWNRLEDWGFTGPYFDWLRCVYSRMRYLVSLDGELSPEFAATSGVLIGDPASPLLWILYLAMFSLPFDPDDADLLGTNISHLEHADDMVIISRTAAGLQRHLRSLQLWCYTNFLSIAVEKTEVMVFHPSAAHERLCPLPVVYIYDTVLRVVEEYKYVGITFSSTRGHMFDGVYDKKRRSALAATHGIFGTERLIGRNRLFPHIARTLYTALVDCHLIYACDVVIDTHMPSFSKLHDVQLAFMRRLLGLGKRSVIVVLYTETGVLPLRARRLILALKYLDYLLSLPRDHFASLALWQCVTLCGANTTCWMTDLRWAVSNLPGADGINLPSHPNLSRDAVQGVIRAIRTATCRDLQSCIDRFSRLSLLRGRLEPVDPASQDEASYRCVCIRHYLTRVLNHHYRRRLTQLLCGALIPMVFRASPGRSMKDTDDVNALLCRACRQSYETPEHVLLHCACLQGPGRDDFFECIGAQPGAHLDDISFLKRCIFDWDVVIPTARFVTLGIDAWIEFCEEEGNVVDDVEDNVVDGYDYSDTETEDDV